MTEQDFLAREQRIKTLYRDGMISLDEKRAALTRLWAEWEASS